MKSGIMMLKKRLKFAVRVCRISRDAGADPLMTAGNSLAAIIVYRSGELYSFPVDSRGHREHEYRTVKTDP